MGIDDRQVRLQRLTVSVYAKGDGVVSLDGKAYILVNTLFDRAPCNHRIYLRCES